MMAADESYEMSDTSNKFNENEARTPRVEFIEPSATSTRRLFLLCHTACAFSSATKSRLLDFWHLL